MSGTLDPQSQRLELERRLGTVVKGLYRLERLLGVGGMGAVYEASDPAGQRFAVKLVHPHFEHSGEHAARFLREARIGEKVESVHVVPVVDDGHEDGMQFLVMPLLRGHDLAGLLERFGPLPPDIAVRLALQACMGLSAAHKHGVVHRDVKPSNLFLQNRQDGEVVLMVSDFGVAKRAKMYDDSDLTRTGASLGSPLYMSPEQIMSSKTVDERSDVWSLAATLYELLCGVTPYGDLTTVGEVMVHVTTRNAPSIQSRAPWVSPDLALAIHQALHREPSGRFETIDAFAGALRAVCPVSERVRASELRSLSDAERRVRAQQADVVSVSCPEGPVSGQAMSGGPEDRLIGKWLGGRYRVLRLLGRGGMGNVYEAEIEGRRVAVKVISPKAAGEGAEAARRFLREAKASRSIDSPHVVKTLDVATDETTGLPFIVMELLQGVDLAVLLKRQGALVPDVLVRVLIQAAHGVAAAHAQGVVHRDIKPANLFLSIAKGDPRVTVKVCDFGVAKRLFDESSDQATHELTRTGGMLGSPMYMSPEQALNAKNIDHRSDIWSLGISLFEGLSARRPWEDRTSIGQIIVAISTASVPSLQELAPWIEPGLAEVVHRTLEKNPDRRFATALELIQALEPFTGATTDVMREDLRGVDIKTRSRVAKRSSLISTTAFGHANTAGGATRSGRRTGLWVFAAVALVALGIVGVVGYRVSTGTAKLEHVAPALKTEEPKTARLVIQPSDATAIVNGRGVDSAGGEIQLTGQPGDRFEVVVTKDRRSRTETVMMGRDGTLNFREVVLPPPPPALSVATVTPTPVQRRPPGPRPSGKVAADTGKATTTNTPAEQAKPTVAPTSGAVPVQDWK
jgi:serine/threonine protein kinase